jgi:hemopexin
VYFFKGDQYLRYDIAADRVDPGYPLPIAGHWPGLWTDHIDAGVVWPNGKAYFFRGSQYIRYDIATDKADPGYPADIKSGWPGFPSDFAAGVDDAVIWNNGKAYFFKGNEYLRYDIAADKTDAGYPAPIAGNWRGLR